MQKFRSRTDSEQEHTRMHKRYYFWTVLNVLFLLLGACAPSLSPLESESQSKSYELVVAREQEVLAAASTAIQSYYSDVVIFSASGKEKGLAFNPQPALNSPTYKFLIEKSYGVTPEGNDIVGYQFFIYADSQLLSKESMDVQPLVTKFKDELAKKGITLILVNPIKSGR